MRVNQELKAHQTNKRKHYDVASIRLVKVKA
jgi:hypothetical protein